MAVRILPPTEVDLYRRLRLEALATNPESFGSTLERETAFTDDVWSARLASFAGRLGVVLVAETPEGPCGLTGVGQREDPSRAMVWGMWVRPGLRRQGIADQLLSVAIAWAWEHDAATIGLTVYSHNVGARRLYESFGFAPVEADAPSDDDHELLLELTRD